MERTARRAYEMCIDDSQVHARYASCIRILYTYSTMLPSICSWHVDASSAAVINEHQRKSFNNGPTHSHRYDAAAHCVRQ